MMQLAKSSLVFGFLLCLLDTYQALEFREETRPLAVSELANCVGGHGGAGCDSCASVHFVLDECAHFELSDPCRKNLCIRNIIDESECATSGQFDCWTTLNPSDPPLTRSLRVAVNCQCENPGAWQVYKTILYGESCSKKYYSTRCTMTGQGCVGEEVSTESSGVSVQCL
jgi:hypothetical protein